MEIKASSFATIPMEPQPMLFLPEPIIPEPPKIEISQAFLEAVAASQRITASKNFAEMFHCTNSNDSASNGPSEELAQSKLKHKD